MRRFMIILICMLLASAPCGASASQDIDFNTLFQEDRAKYAELSKQAAALLKEPIEVPVPPSTSISCRDPEEIEAESQSLERFTEAFFSPENPLSRQMLALGHQLSLVGTVDLNDVALLSQRLGQKAQRLISAYGKDIEKVPAIAIVVMQTAQDMGLLGADNSALLESFVAMYKAGIDELFRRLVVEHDYGTISTILDSAYSMELLTAYTREDIAARLMKALRFELVINYRIDHPSDHWEERATLWMNPVSNPKYMDDLASLEGNGSGTMVSYFNDDVPEAYFTAPNFAVHATLTEFLPCEGTVKLAMSPFYPETSTATLPDEDETFSWEWPALKQGWDLAHEGRLQDGVYVFNLSLWNLNDVAVADTIESVFPNPECTSTLEITLTHKPSK